jgi:hypothetical protein
MGRGKRRLSFLGYTLQKMAVREIWRTARLDVCQDPASFLVEQRDGVENLSMNSR